MGGAFVLTREEWASHVQAPAQSVEENFTVRHPEISDAQAALDLMNLCDIAEYGESDSSLEDLVDEWSGIDLSRDAWLVFTHQNQLIGYAAIFASGQRYTFDFYVHPTVAPGGLARRLLKLCEDRAGEQLKGSGAPQVTAVTIVSQVNQANRQVAEELGYQVRKYYFGMRISFDAPPPPPAWPEGITLRNAVAGQDDRLIYD